MHNTGVLKAKTGTVLPKYRMGYHSRKFNVNQPLPLFKDLSRLNGHINEKTEALNKMAPQSQIMST